MRQDKILLVGHSWGSILGVFMAKARPDLFSAFVGRGRVADPPRNYAVAYDALLAKAFVAIPEAGHFAVFMRAGTFLHELETRVRPSR